MTERLTSVILSAFTITLAWVCVWLAYPVIASCEGITGTVATQVTGMHGVVFAVAWGSMSVATFSDWMKPRVQAMASGGAALGTVASMVGLMVAAMTSLVVTPPVALLISITLGGLGAIAMVRARSK